MKPVLQRTQKYLSYFGTLHRLLVGYVARVWQQLRASSFMVEMSMNGERLKSIIFYKMRSVGQHYE
jgi:hypothetical protein